MTLLFKNHLKSLVAVGQNNENNKFICDSTSFLIGFIAHKSEKSEERLYSLFLVTNKHVFEGRESVYLRFDTSDGKTKIFKQDLFFPNKEKRWLAHENTDIDLALLNINTQILAGNGVQPIFITEEFFAYLKDFSNIGIEVGDEVYVIGFPMGIAGEEQNYPCVKAGLISRIDNEIINLKKQFIIDSSVFPGNSGGPVVLKPTNISLEGTKAVSKSFLVGVVSSYLPYEDKLYTHQTNPPAVVSLTRENSGLSFCVPMDFIKEIYDKWIGEQKQIEEAQKNKNPNNIDNQIETRLFK